MSDYYLVGAANYLDISDHVVYVYLDPSGYPEGEYGNRPIETYGVQNDPFWSLGLDSETMASGQQQVELGLLDSYRIKYTASGIYGWHEASGYWVDILDGIIGAGDDLGNHIAEMDLDMGTWSIISDDVDTSFYFGKGALGYVGGTEYFGIAHRDNLTSLNYALKQSDAGNTIINAKSGGAIYFGNNNVNKMNMSATALTMSIPIDMNSNKITELTAGGASGEAVEFDQLHAQSHDNTYHSTNYEAENSNIQNHVSSPVTDAHHSEQHAMDSATYHTSSDIATLDATTSKHGFLKKLNNSSSNYMNGQGNWATPYSGVSVQYGSVFIRMQATNGATETSEYILLNANAEQAIGNFKIDGAVMRSDTIIYVTATIKIVDLSGASNALWSFAAIKTNGTETFSWNIGNRAFTVGGTVGRFYIVQTSLAAANIEAGDMIRFRIYHQGGYDFDLYNVEINYSPVKV